MGLKKTFAQIDRKKEDLEALRPSQVTTRSLNKDLELRFLYHSENIFGVDWNLIELRVALEGYPLPNRRSSDIKSARKHHHALTVVSNHAKNNEDLSTNSVSQITSLILEQSTQINIEELSALINKKRSGHPIQNATALHIELFKDALPMQAKTLKLARLLMSFELLKCESL